MPAKKSLGQHFLTDTSVVEDIVRALDLQPGERVLEIGPGHGVLTRALLATGARVVAVELDQELIPELEALPGLRVVQGDILSVDPGTVFGEAHPHPLPPRAAEGTQDSGLRTQDFVYKVAGNIPYYISSPILRHLLEASPQPETVVLMLQKELAERVAAQPGDMSLLSVSVQVYGRPRIVRTVPATAFRPAPKVASAIVRIDVYPTPAVPLDNPERFFAIVRAGFAERRKQVHNALQRNYKPAGAHTRLTYAPGDVLAALKAAGVTSTRRAETLTLDEWAGVVREISRIPKPT